MADFTHVWTLAGFVYVAVLVDAFSRRILGRRVLSSKLTPVVTSVVEQALPLDNRGGLIQVSTQTRTVHSDTGRNTAHRTRFR